MPEVSGRSSVQSNAHGVGAFDLSTQQGVAELLRHVRSAALPGVTKTTIRELVLRYSQAGGDANVREELESMLAGLVFVPDAPPATTDATDAIDVAASEPEPTQSQPRGGRRIPTFGVSKSSAAEVAPETPVSEAAVDSQPKPAPVATPTPAPATPVAPAPAQTPVVPAAPTVEPASPAPVSPKPEQDPLERVQEIKKEVIALVGNPVNLVAADNAVGKHYMSALLEAMKKINGGTRIEVAAAMEELEKAFIEVRGLSERGITPTLESEPAPAPVATPTPAPATPVAPAPAQTPVVPAAPAVEPASETSTQPQATPVEVEQESEPAAPSPASQPEPNQATELPGVKENLVQDSARWASEAAAQPPETAPATPADQTSETPDKSLGGAPLQDIPKYGYSKPSDTVFAAPKPNQKTEPPVDQMVAPQSTTPKNPPPPQATPKAKSASAPSPVTPSSHATAATAINSDLMTPEVTAGLEQLLSEWKNFKGSGLFGMGPGGMDHPLYLKMKDNSMLSITNGTFEGASQEVQQSINDYINGWRYEQAIIPQHTESFEHFLRRVVRKVLIDAKQ